MVDTPTVAILENGQRNVAIRASLVSDGTGLSAYKLYDATSSGQFGVQMYGQTLYPGIYSVVAGIDYDASNMAIRLQWEATVDQDLWVLSGASAEDFDWRKHPVRVPIGLAGATGSILMTTVGQVANSSFSLTLRIRKEIPQS